MLVFNPNKNTNIIILIASDFYILFHNSNILKPFEFEFEL